MKKILLMAFVLIISFGLNHSDAKVKPPFSLQAELLNNPASDGYADIKLTASSVDSGTLTLDCDYGKLTRTVGECPETVILDKGSSASFLYRFTLPKPDNRYKIRFTLKGHGMAVRAIVDINAPEEKKRLPGRLRSLPSGEGVRELGP